MITNKHYSNIIIIKKIIFLLFIIQIFVGTEEAFCQIDGDVTDENYGVIHKDAPYSLSGTQFSEDGFTVKSNKYEKKLLRKQKKYSLSPKEKAIKLRKESGDTLSVFEELKYKKISRKEKKLDKLQGEFETDSSTQKVSWSPVKKRSLNPFKMFKFERKSKSDEISDQTRGEDSQKSKEQRKLDRWSKKYDLNENETDIKGKAESGFALSPLQIVTYKKALRKEYRLNKKTDKLYKKALMNIQSESSKKMMKKSAKKTKKRDKQRARKKVYRKIWGTIKFWD